MRRRFSIPEIGTNEITSKLHPHEAGGWRFHKSAETNLLTRALFRHPSYIDFLKIEERTVGNRAGWQVAWNLVATDEARSRDE